MEEEKMRILKMLEEGKISAEEGAKLLETIEEPSRREGGKKFLKIRVFEGNLEKPKVNVNIPLGLIKLATHFVPESARTKMKEKEIDLDQIIQMIATGAEGKLVDVEEEGERVEIFLE